LSAEAVIVNPVMAVAAMGDTPMSPVMTEFGTVVMPALVRMANLAAVPRFTGATPSAAASRAIIDRVDRARKVRLR